MNLIAIALLLFQAAPAKSAPTLSTAERAAISSLEKDKSEAYTQFDKDTKIEDQIIQEFATNHPGYHLTPPPNFEVQQDTAPVKSTAAPLKGTAK